MEVIVSQIRGLSGGIRRLDEEIERQGPKLGGHDSLVSIKGVGTRSATILLSVIGDVEDFADENKLASYFRIVPVVRQSNETEQHGRITKGGSKLGRTTLAQCTLIAIRYSPYLKKFYERIKGRRGTGKAIIATARKFLGIVYQTSEEQVGVRGLPQLRIGGTVNHSGVDIHHRRILMLRRASAAKGLLLAAWLLAAALSPACGSERGAPANVPSTPTPQATPQVALKPVKPTHKIICSCRCGKPNEGGWTTQTFDPPSSGKCSDIEGASCDDKDSSRQTYQCSKKSVEAERREAVDAGNVGVGDVAPPR